MYNLFQLIIDFIADDKGQDFAEYALLLGAVAVVAAATIPQFREEIIANFEKAFAELQKARSSE